MESQNKKQQFDGYVKFTNIALQMLVIIGLGVWGGIKLDQWLHSSPAFTIILSLLGVVIAIFIVIRSLLNKS